MTTYKITFLRADGTTGSDKFSEVSEAAAKRDFKEVYRHSSAKIINVEVVQENVPATKQQEREALEKIKAIIAHLGENSYIGTALEGCLDLAEQNIEFDAAFSLKDELDCERERTQNLEAQLKTLKETEENLKNSLAENRKICDYNNEQYKANLAAATAKALPDDLRNTLLLIVADELCDTRENIVTHAQAISQSLQGEQANTRAYELLQSALQHKAKLEQTLARLENLK